MNAAKFCGYEFAGRDHKDNSVLLKVFGQEQKWVLLREIEFCSTRKRMTSVFKRPDNSIVVFTKGADTNLLPLCQDR